MEGICHRELGKAGWESVQGSATGFKMVRESLSLYPSSSKSLNKGGGGGGWGHRHVAAESLLPESWGGAKVTLDVAGL